MPLGCLVQAGISHGRAVVPGPPKPARAPEAGAGPRPGCAQDCGEVPAAEGSAGREEPGTGRAGWHPALSAAAGAAPAMGAGACGNRRSSGLPSPLAGSGAGVLGAVSHPRAAADGTGTSQCHPLGGLGSARSLLLPSGEAQDPVMACLN